MLIILEDMSRSGSTLTMLHVINAIKDYALVDILICTSKANVNQERLNDYEGLCSKITFGNLPHSMSKGFKFFYSYYINKMKQLVKKQFCNIKYDYVLGHNYFTNGPIFKSISMTYGARCIFYSLSKISAVSKQKRIRKKELISRRLISKYCYKFVSVSSNSLDDLFRCKNKEVFLYDYPSIDSKTTSKRFSSNNKIIIGQIGYFSNNKNQMFTLKIVNSLCKMGVDCSVCFLGYKAILSTTYFDELTKYINYNNLNEKVAFYESDYDKDVFFDSIDVLLQPSFSEGYGLAVLESLSRRTPAICSDAIPNEICFNGVYKKSLSNFDEWIDLLMSEDYKKEIIFNNDDIKHKFINTIKEILN